MKPACPLLGSEFSGKPNTAQCPPKQAVPQAQNEGLLENRMGALESRVKQRPKKQMFEMENRMLGTILGLSRLRQMQNSHNNHRPNQAKAAWTPDESVNDVDRGELQDLLFNVMSEEQSPRQDHVKVLKLTEKRQFSLLECRGHKVTE